jgi:hypothetical protein
MNFRIALMAHMQSIKKYEHASLMHFIYIFVDGANPKTGGENHLLCGYLVHNSRCQLWCWSDKLLIYMNMRGGPATGDDSVPAHRTPCGRQSGGALDPRPPDRAFNRVLGRASYRAIFALLKTMPRGGAAIVDAWFGFQPPDLLAELIADAEIDEVAGIWCAAAPDVIAAPSSAWRRPSAGTPWCRIHRRTAHPRRAHRADGARSGPQDFHRIAARPGGDARLPGRSAATGGRGVDDPRGIGATARKADLPPAIPEATPGGHASDRRADAKLS